MNYNIIFTFFFHGLKAQKRDVNEIRINLIQNYCGEIKQII